jgi:hypothetical protein
MTSTKFKTFFLIALCSFLSALQAQNDSSVNSNDILPWDQTNLKNEICIQNFFPMIFNSWGGGSSVMYRRYFRNGKSALRARIDGAINNQNRNAFNNTDLAEPIPDEFNNLGYGNSSVNFTLGYQHTMVKQKNFNLYSFIDFTFGKGGYYNSGMYSQTASGVGKGRTILSFSINETQNTNVTFNLGTGIGAQMKVYKNLFVAIESQIQLNKVTTTSIRKDKSIEYDITTNSYVQKNLIETNEPITSAMNLSLTPISTIYFTFKF